MNKELEALEELKKIDIIIDGCAWNYKDTNYKESFDVLEKYITPPTADEVCREITDFINGLGFVEEKINVVYDNQNKEFYYMSKRTDDVIWYKKIVVAIQTISDTKDRTIFLDVMKLSPHLITIIGKFYESLEAEK